MSWTRNPESGAIGGEGGGLRPIETGDFAALAADLREPGAAPMLQWVKIADLVVDDAYQRPIYGAGRKNVRRIAEGFRWAKFAPVIVAPVAGGKFAIIDGQHRTTAAALRGFDTVPAQVIVADPVEQAAAFRSINGQVTRVARLSLHRAAVAAGDPGALELDEAVRAGGAWICPYPKAANLMVPGETMAVAAVTEALRNYGRDVVVLGLRCLTETANHKPGALGMNTLRALFWVIGGNARWRAAGDALVAAFDDIDVAGELEEALCTRRPKGTAAWEILAGFLIERLREAGVGTAAA